MVAKLNIQMKGKTGEGKLDVPKTADEIVNGIHAESKQAGKVVDILVACLKASKKDAKGELTGLGANAIRAAARSLAEETRNKEAGAKVQASSDDLKRLRANLRKATQKAWGDDAKTITITCSDRESNAWNVHEAKPMTPANLSDAQRRHDYAATKATSYAKTLKEAVAAAGVTDEETAKAIFLETLADMAALFGLDPVEVSDKIEEVYATQNGEESREAA